MAARKSGKRVPQRRPSPKAAPVPRKPAKHPQPSWFHPF